VSAYAKNILRTIIGNKRRSLLLLLITALGAAFFVGLRSTSPDMNITFDRYFDQQGMYDVRVISNFGLTDQDISRLRELDGVEQAEPAYSADLFAKLGDASHLFRFHSMTPPASEGPMAVAPVVIEGRMPEHSGECAVAHRFSLISCCAIGDILTLSTGDDTALTGIISQEKFVVTGLVESPLYLRTDMGPSSKGSGSLQSYAYVLFDDFNLNVYTEAQIYLRNPQGLSRFDDRYKDLSAAVEDELQATGDEIAARRRRLTIERALKEIADGTKMINGIRGVLAEKELELSEGELALAVQEWEFARQKDRFNQGIADGHQKLEAGDEEISKAYQTIAESKSMLSAAYRELEGMRAFQAAGDASLGVFDASYLSRAEAVLKEKENEIAAAEAELEEQRITLLVEEANLNSALYGGLVQFIFAESELREARDALIDGKLYYEAEKTSAEAMIKTYEQKLALARRMISALPKAKCYVLGLDQNLGFASFEQDSKRIDSISYVFPLIFFLVSALVAFTSMVRIVEDDRPTVAAMQSLGYKPGMIAGKYIIYALSVSVPGTILGIAVGYQLIPATVFNFGYKIMYLLPSIETPLHMNLCALTLGVTLLSVILPTVLVTLGNTRESPAALMRPKAPLPGKRIALERMKPLWSAMNFSAKVTARNIFRYKKRFIMTIAGIAGCTAIVLTGFGVRDSVMPVASNQFDRIFYYSFQITLSDGAGRADKASLERYLAAQNEVTEWQYQHRRSIDVSLDKKGAPYLATLVVPDDASRLSAFVKLAQPHSSKPVEPVDDGAVITQKLANLLGASPGDMLTLTDKDDNDMVYLVRIASVTENYVSHYIYMTPEHFRSLAGLAPDFSTILVKAAAIGAARRDEISEDILENSSVSALSINSKTRDFYADTINSLNVVVLVLLISGMLLAFVVLFCLTGINIDERKRELATLMVLGFYDKEASSHIFRENIVNTAVGVIIGLLFGILLHQYVMRTAEVDMILFEKVIKPQSYVFSAALTFFYMFIVNAAMSGSIRSIDMIESLKSVE
jgi:putative ABC transport system permease protein